MGCMLYKGLFDGYGVDDCQWVCQVLFQVGFEGCVVSFFVSFFGGEKQCVLLVCVLVQELCLLIFDELINYFDLCYQLEFLCLLCGFGLSILVSFYDFNLVVVFCDCFYVFDGGCIVVQGMLIEVFDVDLLWWVFGVCVLVDCYFFVDYLCLIWII